MNGWLAIVATLSGVIIGGLIGYLTTIGLYYMENIKADYCDMMLDPLARQFHRIYLDIGRTDLEKVYDILDYAREKSSDALFEVQNIARLDSLPAEFSDIPKIFNTSIPWYAYYRKADNLEEMIFFEKQILNTIDILTEASNRIKGKKPGSLFLIRQMLRYRDISEILMKDKHLMQLSKRLGYCTEALTKYEYEIV